MKRKAAHMQTEIETRKCQADFCQRTLDETGSLMGGTYYLTRQILVPVGAVVSGVTFVCDFSNEEKYQRSVEINEARIRQDEIDRLRDLGVVFHGDMEAWRHGTR